MTVTELLNAIETETPAIAARRYITAAHPEHADRLMRIAKKVAAEVRSPPKLAAEKLCRRAARAARDLSALLPKLLAMPHLAPLADLLPTVDQVNGLQLAAGAFTDELRPREKRRASVKTFFAAEMMKAGVGPPLGVKPVLLDRPAIFALAVFSRVERRLSGSVARDDESRVQRAWASWRQESYRAKPLAREAVKMELALAAVFSAHRGGARIDEVYRAQGASRRAVWTAAARMLRGTNRRKRRARLSLARR